KNQSGKYIEPTADSASAAGKGITVQPNLVFAAYNSPDPEAYPITYQSWVIVYQNQTNAGKGALVKAYLTYLLGDGQDPLPALDHAKLPDELKAKAVAQLDQLKVG